MNEKIRKAKQVIQLIRDKGGYWVVHTKLVKSAGPFTRMEAKLFYRKAIVAEAEKD